MSIKASERLAIISEFIKNGSCREGYTISETKDGKYRIRKTVSEQDKLIAKRDKLKKQLESIESEINKFNQPVQESKPVEQLDIKIEEAI